MKFNQLYKNNHLFFLSYFIFLITSSILLIAESKKEIFTFLNPYHTNFLNYFFIGITFIGDGIFSVLISILLILFRKKSLGIMVFVSFAVSGLIVQVLKAFISEARPAIFLKGSNYPYFIDHVTLHNFHSFPSGHTTSVFALITLLAFAINKKIYAILLLGLGILVGYSRIYLGQHFLWDVVVGSITGVICSIICWLLFQKYSNKG